MSLARLMVHTLGTASWLCVKVFSAALITGGPSLPCVLAKSGSVSSLALLSFWFSVTLIQLNCEGEMILEMIVVVCFPQKSK